MRKVLFVCLGNICRSPMAEAIFNNIVTERNLADQLEADSAGTAGYHIGDQPDHRTTETLENHGIVSKHLGRKLTKSDFEEFDHIAVMDNANFEEVHTLYYNTYHEPPSAEKLFMIRDYDPDVRGPHDVPDPYYENKKAFEEVYQILTRSIDGLINHLAETYQIEPKEIKFE